jgi:hypothetical protein
MSVNGDCKTIHKYITHSGYRIHAIIACTISFAVFTVSIIFPKRPSDTTWCDVIFTFFVAYRESWWFKECLGIVSKNWWLRPNFISTEKCSWSATKWVIRLHSFYQCRVVDVATPAKEWSKLLIFVEWKLIPSTLRPAIIYLSPPNFLSQPSLPLI